LPDPVVNGQPYDGFWWDGTDDAAKAVPPDLYNIHVTSTNTVTGASYTTIQTVTLTTAPPTAPGAVTAMNGPMQIDVEWTPAAPGGAPIAQYIVWRSSCAACIGFGFSVGPSASTFQDGQLPGTVGYYRVQAQDSFGVKGPLSPQVVATSGAAAGTLLKSQSPAAPIPGGPLAYLLTVVNPNGVGMYLHMWDTLPAGFTFAALEGFPAPSGTTLIPSTDGVHSVLDWWVGNAKVIMNSGIYTFTLTGQAPAISGTFCNEAHAEMWVGA